MNQVSLGDVWEDTLRFVSRELALIVPLALVTLGLGGILLNFAMPPAVHGAVPPGAWMWVVPAVMLFWLVGTLALTELALTPGGSVREALRAALRALPRAIGMAMLLGLGGMAVVSIASILFMLIGTSPQRAVASTVAFVSIVIMMLSARFALGSALIVRGRTPLRALRESWQMTLPLRWRVILLMLAFLVVGGLLVFAVQVTVGSMLLLVGRLAGMPLAGIRLAQVAVTLATSLLQAGWLIYLALLYRRLAGER